MNAADRSGRDTLRRLAPLGSVAAGLALGGAARLAGHSATAEWLWAAATASALAPLAASTARRLRRGELGVDLIALAAMAVALLLRQNLAGAVIALMMSGGEALEAYAGARARRDLEQLLHRAPAIAQRWDGQGFSAANVAGLLPGDRLLVRNGDVLPVDGVVQGTDALIDESALTGEAMPVVRGAGERVRSGTVNAGGAFEIRAAATAAESTYARIVRLVEAAQRAKAPLVRLADRWARVFLLLTGGLAAGAWALSGDPRRALAVLVIATPCPLILAAPAAFVAGLSRAARRGVIVKSGRALEALARVRTMLVDKTGTVTAGEAELVEVVALANQGETEILELAASLDQVSPHVFAGAIVDAARRRRLRMEFPRNVEERPGQGIAGEVGNRMVALGSVRWMAERGIDVPPPVRRRHSELARDGSAGVLVALDGRLAAILRLEDPLRPDAPGALAALRRAGIARIVLVTGDHPEVAHGVAARLGVDRVVAECTPEDKVAAVDEARRDGPTMMVGDGLNDAPALAAADVGVAMAPRGTAAPAEAADVVLTVDRLDRLVEAIAIARRSRRMALQSIVAGMALSAAGMIAAAAGLLAPLAGALLQEAIDVAVLLNALRALSTGVRGNEADLAGGPALPVRAW